MPIVSDVQGHNDLIIDGYNGFLYDNQKQLMNILFKLSSILTEDKYLELSANAKKTGIKLASYSINIIKKHFLKYE
ncbi:MAG: hypothetical protein V1649_01200 [Patescibacteria group bacterium]